MACSSKSENAHTRISIMNTAQPRGVVATQSTPPPNQPLMRQYSLVGNGCRSWVRPKESYFPAWICTLNFFPLWLKSKQQQQSSGRLAYWDMKHPNHSFPGSPQVRTYCKRRKAGWGLGTRLIEAWNGEATECAVCKHCGCMMNTDHISYYINQVP